MRSPQGADPPQEEKRRDVHSRVTFERIRNSLIELYRSGWTSQRIFDVLARMFGGAHGGDQKQ